MARRSSGVTRPIVFCWVGRTTAPYAREGERQYVERIERYQPCRVVAVAEERQGSRYSAEHRLEREGTRIIERVGKLDPAFVVAVDPRGQESNSREFAKLLRQQAFEAGRTPVFVVGGPDGLSSSVRQRANRLLGLSRLTLPHDMARLLVVEQVYRALTIIHGHPYDR